MKMVVRKEKRNKKVCRVTLYERDFNQDVSINACLVLEGYARESGKWVKQFWNRRPDIQPGMRTACLVGQCPVSSQNITKVDVSLMSFIVLICWLLFFHPSAVYYYLGEYLHCYSVEY